MNLAADGEIKNLYAQWLALPDGDSYDSTEGVYRFTLKAGETATIPNLPAGVHYELNYPASTGVETGILHNPGCL